MTIEMQTETMPSWLRSAVVNLPDPAKRVKSFSSAVVEHKGAVVHRVDFTFGYLDPRGEEAIAGGMIYLPPELQTNPARRFPLVVEVGYQTQENTALDIAQQGSVFVHGVIPAEGEAWPGVHPIARGINLDLALLHVARSLPCIDGARVMILGISIGGRNALLLAAESFPICGVMADAPAVNWPWTATYLLHNETLAKGPLPSGQPETLPWLATGPVAEVVNQGVKGFGADPSAAPWTGLSPVEHLDKVSCPVAAFFSSADMLVPIGTIDRGLEQPFDSSRFPAGFTTERDVLGLDARARRRLLEALDPEDVEVRVAPVPEDAVLLNYEDLESNTSWKPVKIEPSTKRWSLTIVDEGPIEPHIQHVKHQIYVHRQDVVADWKQRSLDLDQLTTAKLEVLMRRYAGIEWVSEKFRHLDLPEAERADVLRGLRTYVAEPGGAQRFLSLYAALPADLKGLGRSIDAATSENVSDALEELCH